MNIIKWVLILIIIFLSSILAGPFFAVACWLDRKKADIFLDHIGEKLKDKLISEFKK